LNTELLVLMVMIANSLSFAFGTLLLKKSNFTSRPLGLSLVKRVFSNIRFLIGNGLLASTFIFLMIAYRHADLGFVLPMGSLVHVFSLVLGRIYFSEPITWNKIAGILCIFAGVTVLTLGI